MKTLTMDPEFQALIRRLDSEEYATLEQSILADGCRDAIVVWNGTIVDGHHRYEICTRHGIPFNTVDIHFDSRDEAIIWIIDNQLARRNLSKYERSTLVLRKKDTLESLARQRQVEYAGIHKFDKSYAKDLDPNLDQGLSHSSNGATRPERRTLDILAEEAGVSRGTLHSVHVIETSGLECVRELVRRNELSIHRAYQLVRGLEKLPEEDRELAAALCGEYVEKAAILVRLYKSSQRDGSNDTYGEIMSTGGFHHGTDMEEWRDFAKSTVDEIEEALKSLAAAHAIVAMDTEPDRKTTLPHVAHNSGNNEWYTPREYIEAARTVMGHIDLDPASNEIANRVVRAESYYTAQTNGLEQPWFGNIWMNPPFSSDLIGEFVQKFLLHWSNREVQQAIILVNNATETRWFQKLGEHASAFCFPAGRIKFWNPNCDTAAPLQGQAVLYFGDNVSVFADVFAQFGLVLCRYHFASN
ncbi:MAG: hypothetical protein KatS3mg051_1155 [Anaerolineae bacterium]|nr:MAG: hypothetical protein KatS3mg051_1155 [Anaerolineae bacterium]